MKSNRPAAYILCVGVTIALVVFGWFWTTRVTFVKNVSSAKKEFSGSILSAKEEIAETKKLKQNAEDKWQKAETAADAITNFVEKKETVSKSLIENLKQRIEVENYEQEGTKKTAIE
ncbi:hypothetical protein HY771_01170 [Candidatus Uhrbacteria bacterium]|nr:hypothetical protein [Candidatus Uhrbacteria bacterium]